MENVLVFLLGWSLAALINYLSEVLPYRRKLVYPFCLECRLRLPLRNYFLAPRRCPACSKRRSLSTWIFEAVFSLAVVWLWNAPPPSVGFYTGLILLTYFGLVIMIDLKYRLILHPVSIAGAVIGFSIGSIIHGPVSSLIGGAVGFGLMYVFYFVGILFGRWMARRRGVEAEEALGFGDVNLSGVLGLVLGWPLIIPGLILAVVVGGIFSVFFMVLMLAARRYNIMMAIPYGPFLILGAILLLFFPEFIVSLINP
jgi:leader peptidase (prepilin peptidase) / N-methyltransferase